MAAAMPQTPRTAQTEWHLDLPRIDQDEALGEMVRKLSV